MTVMLVTLSWVRAEGQRLRHHLIQLDHRPRGLALAREGQQVPDDPGGPLRLAENGIQAPAHRLVGLPLGQPLGRREDCGERVVQLVRDARDCLPEGCHLLRLEELVVEIPRLIFEPLPIAHIPDQGFDANGAAPRRLLGTRRHLHPHRRPVRPSQAQQVIGHRPVAMQPLEEGGSRHRIGEAALVERPHVRLGSLDRVAEDELQVGIGSERGVTGSCEGADVDAFVDQLEQAGKRLSAWLTGHCPVAAGIGHRHGSMIIQARRRIPVPVLAWERERVISNAAARRRPARWPRSPGRREP